MLLWTALALMTGAAALAALWPLAQRPGRLATGDGSDIAIYKDQLAELVRDEEHGLIARPEAEAARLEVARRLLAADAARSSKAMAADRARAPASPLRPILVAVPAIGLGLYGLARLAGAAGPAAAGAPRRLARDASVDDLVMRVEAHLAENPDDAKGWQVLAPIYMRAGRPDDAVLAWSNAIRLTGRRADREAALGEAASAAAEGVVTAAARAAFERAVKLDGANAKARYFLGRAKEQDGDKAAAIAAWRAVRAAEPPGSPIAAFLDREIARLDGPSQAGPDGAAAAAAQGMAPADRDKMIRGMVEGLAARLQGGGGSEEDWLELVRAWSVLGEKDKALAAAVEARKALTGSPEAIRALDDLTKSSG